MIEIDENQLNGNVPTFRGIIVLPVFSNLVSPDNNR